MKRDSKIHGYFRLGDIVIDTDSYYNDVKFVVVDFLSGAYRPEIKGRQVGKPDNNVYRMNLEVAYCKLYDAVKRPLKNIGKIALMKLVNSGNVEARREFDIRINTKTL